MKHCTFIQCTKVGNKHVLQIWFYSIFRGTLRVRNDGTNWEHHKKKDGGTKNHKKHHLVFWDFLRIPPWWIFLTSSPPKKPQLSRTPCELGYWNHRPLKNAPRAKTPAVLLFLPTFSSQCWIFVCGSQTRTRKGRCWGLKSIYFLTGNRRKNTPQLLNSLVSCGCFCFKSSRFFSTIFWTPKKGLAFFSGENPSNWLMSDRQVLPRWSLVSFTPAVDDKISKEYRPSSPVIHGFQWKNCWDKFERYLQTTIAGRSSFFCRRYSCFFHCHV